MLELLPRCQQQDFVSQLLVADQIHKDTHERCNMLCGFLGICYQVSLPGEQQTDSFLGGRVLGYYLFDTLRHVHTTSLQLWKCSRVLLL